MHITQVTLFRTEDGEIFENVEVAASHAAMLTLKSRYSKMRNGKPGGMSFTEVLSLITCEREAIIKFLDVTVAEIDTYA